MKEWPCLFTAEMIRALASGRKTVTRRVGGFWGKVEAGDRLWTRETWGYRGAAWNNKRPDRHEVDIIYRADDLRRSFIRFGPQWDKGLPKQRPPPQPRHEEDWERIEARTEYFGRWWKSWQPSIFQPRWAAREVVEVVSSRWEPWDAITEDEIVAEGCTVDVVAKMTGTPWGDIPDLFTAWRLGWDFINGDRAPSKDNPQVRRVEFRTLPPSSVAGEGISPRPEG